MNVLQTILSFLTQLAQIIFPRHKRLAAGDCPCPHPQPAPVEPPLPPDAGNGSDAGLHRSDTLALAQGSHRHHYPPNYSRPAESDWLGLSGYSLMLIGGAGCLYRWFMA